MKISTVPVVFSSLLLLYASWAVAAGSPHEVDEDAWRSSRPTSSKELTFSLPPVEEVALPSGARLLLVERHVVPLVTIRVIVRGTTRFEPKGKEGLARLVARMWAKGTASHDETEFGRLLDDLGASLETTSDADGAQLTVTVGREQLSSALRLVADALVSPRLSQAALDASRADIESEIRGIRPGARHANLIVRERIYGREHFYGRPLRGSIESLESISRDDVLRFHRQVYVPSNVSFVLTGDVYVDEAKRMLNGALGSWTAPAHVEVAPVSTAAPLVHPGVLLKDVPGAQQANIAMGIALPGVMDSDWPIVEILTRTLAGAFNSRLSRILRQEKGVAYSVSAGLDMHIDRSSVVVAASVSLGATGESVTDMVSALSNLKSSPPQGLELLRIRNTLIFDIASDFDTTAGMASALTIVGTLSLPKMWLGKDMLAWSTVGLEQLRTGAESYFNPAKAVIVIEGPVDSIEPQLRAQGIAFELLP